MHHSMSRADGAKSSQFLRALLLGTIYYLITYTIRLTDIDSNQSYFLHSYKKNASCLQFYLARKSFY